MNQEELNQAARYSRAETRRRIWKRFVSGVACVVVFCTVYSLILPALTLEEGVYCGLEEHQHEEGCYESTLVCDYEADETQAAPAHEHTESCYTPQRELVCGQEESAGHVHTVECVSAQQVLICENTDPEHTHEDGCYETREVSVCGLAEGDGAHTHTDECYAETDVLTCTLNTAAETTEGTEAPAHTHDESCYEQTLVCELEEHTHSLSCYSNPDADVESADVWARSVSGATLTGVWSDDVIAVAKTQLGYQESRNNYQVMDDGVTVKGYTRYGDWYGEPYGDWSAMFVSFCLDYAGIPQSAIPQESGCSRWVQQLTQKGLYHRSGYEPKKGDLVFFDMDGDGASDRVGLVSGVTADETGHVTQFNTIEGDSANSVQRSSYTVGQSTVSGFAALPENPSAPQETVTEPTAETVPEETATEPTGETTPETTAETVPETTGETVPEETVPETTAETVPEENIKETMGDIQTLPNNTPSAEIQAVEGALEGLELGKQMNVSVAAGQTVKLAFTPTVTHEYVFVSKANADTYGHLYDADGNEIKRDDDGAGSGQFKVTYNLTAGTIYYFGVRYYNSSNSGTIPVLLTLGGHVIKKNEAGELVCDCGFKVNTGAELTLNEQTDVQVTGQNMVYLPYTPELTHYYAFEASPTAEMYEYLYDQNLKFLTSSYGSASYKPKITRKLNGGELYYFGVKYTSNSASGAIPVRLTLSTHTYVKNEDGIYVCNCGKPAPTSGVCGEDAYWSYADGVLTISGTGAMYDFSGTTMPWYLFRNDINSVVVEPDVTSIGQYAFYAHKSLTGVSLPSTLTDIAQYAFEDCTGLTDIALPESITSIGYGAFKECSGLTEIVIPGSVARIEGRTFYYCTGLTNVVIGDGVTSIGSEAFYRCSSLTGINIPATVTGIGSCAFQYCSKLTGDLVIPEGVTKIEDSTFEECGALTGVTLPDGLTSIGNKAFYNCRALTRVNIPQGVTKIGTYAFYHCERLTSVPIPDSVTTIGDNAFNTCSALKSVNIPDSVTYLGKGAFSSCTSLTEIVIPNSITSVPDSAFSYCSNLTRAVIPDGIQSIGNYAFYFCQKLSELSLPETVTQIGDRAFEYGYRIPNIHIPEGVTRIGIRAFANCRRFTEINIPESITSIGENVLSECRGLETLYWNAKGPVEFAAQDRIDKFSGNDHGHYVDFTVVVGQEAELLTGESFAQLVNMGCGALEFRKPNYITLSALDAPFTGMPLSTLPESRYYIDEFGVFYRIDEASGKAYVAYCPAGLGTLTVPASIPAENGGAPIPVVGVDTYAFRQATVSALTFDAPESITVLSDFAFYGAKNLASVNGAGTTADVLAILNKAATGKQLFVDTKITDNGVTDQPLYAEGEDIQLTISTAHQEQDKHDPAMGENSAFLYYTGEGAKTTITVSNPESGVADTGDVVRVYFRFDSPKGGIDYPVGHYEVESEITGHKYSMDVIKTDTPNCYCLILQRPEQGDTLSLTVTSEYPSPDSAGGSAAVWGGILNAEKNAALGTGLLPANQIQLMEWGTVPDEFPVRKTGAYSLYMTGDGKGGAVVRGLSYYISISRVSNTLEKIGKDYVTYVEFEDTLTLPEGARFTDNAITAIRNGRYSISTAWSNNCPSDIKLDSGGTFVGLDGNNQYAEDITASIIGDNQLVLRWKMTNPDLSTELPREEFTVEISPYNDFVVIPDPVPGKDYTFDNKVTATEHFMYSEDRIENAELSKTIQVTEGSLNFQKNISNKNWNPVFGSVVEYTITANNPGVTNYEGMGSIRDTLPYEFYLTAGQMASLFSKDPAHQLSISITYATLCTPKTGDTVVGIDGSSNAVLDNQYTGGNTHYSGMSGTDPDCVSKEKAKISLTWATEDQIRIKIDDREPVLCAPNADSIQRVLDEAGFVVTSSTQYALVWDLTGGTGEPYTLAGGEKIEKIFNTTVKDTFMQLDRDQRYRYSRWGDLYNYAYVYSPDNREIKNAKSHAYTNLDFSLTKGWSKDGRTISQDLWLEQGDVLDNTLSVSHTGAGKYDALPLVDHMSGAQALLVSKELNQGADWAEGCNTVIVKEKEYYLLTQPMTYSHVWTSETQMADSVTVTAAESGLDTVIKWYFTNYSGSRSDNVTYQSMVCPNDVASGAVTYHLGNETWLGDHESHRLYNNVPDWWGVNFHFDKKIVDGVGDTGSGTSYCLVHEDQTIVYRLTVHSPTDKDGNPLPMLLTGKDLYDELPGSIGEYRWSKDNVSLTYGEGLNCTNEDHWSVTDLDSDQQYIRWDDDFSMTFTGIAHIYVTLTYPKELDWQAYALRYGAETLVNSFHVFNSQRSVTHDLAIPGRVRLQKGVYASGEYTMNDSRDTVYVHMNGQQDARYHYSNKGARDYVVQYYVTLYNGGLTKLYLTEIWDRLPRGFTMYDYGHYEGNLATVYRADGTVAEKRRMSYNLKTETAEDGSQLLCFTFEKPNYTSSTAIRYDESRKMYYLNPGEYITFDYVCLTNEEPDTDDVALNTVSMPYYDYTGAGVTVDTDSKTVVKDEAKATPNDGGCVVENNGQALNRGFTGGTSSTQWLTSEVTVTRGEIKPGITKALTSATSTTGHVTENPVSVGSLDLLTWTVTAENDGTFRLEDYTLTDRMQAPYMFTGNVAYTTYSVNTSSGRPESRASFGFTIQETDVRDELNIIYGGKTYALTIGGDPVQIKITGGDLWLSICRDEAENAVMSIRLTGKYYSIPAGGSGKLTLSTKNTTDQVVNKQFLNTCFITPMNRTQTWDGTTNKGNVVDLETPFLEGTLPTVRNSAPVTTSYGYTTSSVKQVTEILDQTNTAYSDRDPNFIVLGSPKSLFRYTITVNNSTPAAMEKLILIDGLPEVGDHTVFLDNDPRFSQFKVSLTDSPNFTLTVTDNETHESKTLDPADYRVEYSTKTSFTNSDWKGLGEWECTTAGEARSIRIIVDDPGGTLIPAKSTVSVTFDCKVDGPADPGAIAWNSFGYHYKLLDNPAELEAAPLKVGVKIPSVPQLKKQLVDRSGKPITAKTEQTFSFLLYQGQPLEGCKTADEMEAKLTEDGTAFHKFTLTVPEGQSASKAMFLKVDDWEWENGKSYTLAEYPTDEDYAFRGFDVTGKNTFTFVYNKAEDKVITCQNTSLRWSVELTKTDPTGKKLLPGAVFALYSPNADDGQTPPEGSKAEPRIERGGATWYYVSEYTTDETGKITWPNLLRESYWLLELQAPSGYYITKVDGWLLESKKESQGIYTATVINSTGHELPNSGGTGTTLYTTGGALLIGCAAMLLLYKKKKRGKEDPASS